MVTGSWKRKGGGEAEISSLDISGSMAASPSLCSFHSSPLFPPIITGKLLVRGCDRRREMRGVQRGESSKLSKKTNESLERNRTVAAESGEEASNNNF